MYDVLGAIKQIKKTNFEVFTETDVSVTAQSKAYLPYYVHYNIRALQQTYNIVRS